MKTVVRIEHPKDGYGLWQSTNQLGQLTYQDLSFYNELVDKCEMLPVASEDGLNRADDDFFAFKSIEDVQYWINKEWWDKIFQLGFKVLLIDVLSCREGQYQVLFKKKDIIYTKDISSLFQ